MDKKYTSVEEFFKHYLKVSIDKKLIEQLKLFRHNWISKSPEYIELLGSNLLGTHFIRFSSIDDIELMKIFRVDDLISLQEEFYKVKGIVKGHKIASNVIYNTLVYISHRFITSKSLSDNSRKDGVRECCLIMQYKMFSSIYSHYFKYQVDENVAITVYNKLSHKYLIKKLKSWQDVFEYRVNTCLDKKNPNYKRLLRLTTEDSIRIITDIQTKIRSSIITIYKILVEVTENKDYITSEDTTFIGGENNEKQIRDIDNIIFNNITKIKKIIYNENEFIDNKIIQIVDSMFKNIDKNTFQQLLVCLTHKDTHESKELDKIKKKIAKIWECEVDDVPVKVIEHIIIISYRYTQRIGINIRDRSNIPKSIVLVKNYWSSSKVKDRDIDLVKEYINRVSYVCTKKKTSWLLATLTLGVILYIYILSLKQEE